MGLLCVILQLKLARVKNRVLDFDLPVDKTS